VLKIAAKVTADGRELLARWRAKRRKVLFRTGAYSLKVFIRQPIRSAKKSAGPGAVPKGHTRALKKNSAFEVDESGGTVDVGFLAYPSDRAQPLGGQTVPETLFHGGRQRLDLPARTVTTPDGRLIDLAPASVVASYEPRPTLLADGQTKAADKCADFLESTPL
jgi:hypothetical protein